MILILLLCSLYTVGGQQNGSDFEMQPLTRLGSLVATGGSQVNNNNIEEQWRIHT